MAEEQQRDNFWLYIGGIIVLTIVLVVMLKSRETEHLKSGAVAELQKETFQQIDARKKATSNKAE
ncbi:MULTISPECIES: hypothetical protein [unclassified Methylobacter]|jgi:hypothetical protein|uniref:hypothetical protein n=1 Tax=unclassified Methylobacter TaxID=2635283 RepID=UPI001894D797|nr:hypothetical protein [Methylobacter sp. BlB1]MBF6649465.1 hypothetical protein [Methylobacter sp. BlB1]